MPGKQTVRMCLGKDAKEVANWIVMLYLTQKSNCDSVIETAPCSTTARALTECHSSLYYGDKYSYYNCIKLSVRVVLKHRKDKFNIPRREGLKYIGVHVSTKLPVK